MIKNNKISIICFLILIIFSVSCLGYQEINKNGGNDSAYYSSQVSYWNNANTPSITGTQITLEPKRNPLISDFDGDGLNEVAIIDANYISFYSVPELNLLGSFKYDTNSKNVSNLISIDYNSDGKKEIIFFSDDSRSIKFIQYNGTQIKILDTVNVSSSFPYGVTNSDTSYMNLQCDDTLPLKCVGLYQRSSGFENKIISFNSSGVQDFKNLTLPSDGICFSRYPSVIDDINLDGVSDIIFTSTMIDADGTSTYYGQVDSFSVYDNLTLKNNSHFQESMFSSLQDNCNTLGLVRGANFVTNPQVDYFLSPSSGKYVMFGVHKSSITFQIKMLDSNLQLYRTFPRVGFVTVTTDGELISSMAKDNTGTQKLAYVMGYQANNSIFVLEINPLNFYQSIEYHYSGNTSFNPKTSTGSASLDYNQIFVGKVSGSDLNNIYSTYGTFMPDTSIYALISCSATICYLKRNYENPYGLSALLPVDGQKVSRTNLLIQKANNMYYLTDGFQNTGCDSENCITSQSYNPCITSAWNQSTQTEIRIKVEDLDLDSVSARAFMYYGTNLQQNDTRYWNNNYSSGTEFIFSAFNINSTYNGAILRIEATERGRNQVEVLEKLISIVPTGGKVYGECITTDTNSLIENTTIPVYGTYDENVTLQDNYIKQQFFNTAHDMGIPAVLLFLLIMFGTNVILFIGAMTNHVLSHHIITVIIGIFFINVFSLIIATLMGIVSIWLVLTLSVLIASVGILYVVYLWNKSHSG